MVGYIAELAKTRTFWFFVGGVVAVIAYSIYDGYQTKVFMLESQNKIERLTAELDIKNKQNLELEKRGADLDLKLQEERARVTTVINNFPQEQRPVIKDSDSAVRFIYDFLRK